MSSSSAAPRADVPCDLMSPEEMRECLVSKPHAAGRSKYCDLVTKSHIQGCLKEKDAASTGASGESSDRSGAKPDAK